MKKYLNKKNIIISCIAFAVICMGAYFFAFSKDNKRTLAIKSLAALNRISQILPIEKDIKKELNAVNELTQKFTKKDNVERRFLILLQNTMELRPGGGFLGQYAIIKVKNGEVTSTFVEDANLLDQRITAKVRPPYPFKQLMQIKKWKFRDSNFSPDFPTNAEKAKYFYRLSGRNSNFDGVIAINSDVLNDILELTGPIKIPGYSATFTSKDAILKIEDIVEKPYINNPDLDTQNRKAILKTMANVIIDKLFSLNNIPKLANFAHEQMKKKNVMLNFEDSELQKIIEEVHWDGSVAKNWSGDYLMIVDANMGALKTNYYMDYDITYDIDLTQERPVATLNILYKNNAPYENWRASDYHSYLRVYVPKGSELIERKMIGYTIENEDFGKTYFGAKVDVIIKRTTDAMLKYQLPADFNKDDYKLLIQKQSGIGDLPIKIKIKTEKGELDYENTLVSDLKIKLGDK